MKMIDKSIVEWVESKTRVAWTEEQIDMLLQLQERGYTGSQIADKMRKIRPEITRNAVLGKLERIKRKSEKRKKYEIKPVEKAGTVK